MSKKLDTQLEAIALRLIEVAEKAGKTDKNLAIQAIQEKLEDMEDTLVANKCFTSPPSEWISLQEGEQRVKNELASQVREQTSA